MPEFVIPEIAGEHVVRVAQLAATRDTDAPGTGVDRAIMELGLGISPELARRAISAAEQLGFVKSCGDGHYTFEAQDEIRYARKADLHVFLKERLLAYPPFLILASQLMQDFPADEAASFTVAVLGIRTAPHKTLKTLQAWGVYAHLFELDGGTLKPTFEPVKLLDLGFLRRLNSAMDDNAKVRAFVVQELGPELVAEMSRKGLGGLPISLADALVRHESDPRRVGDPVGSMIESYCASLFPTPVQANSLPDLAAKLEQHGHILGAHKNLLIGMAGFRHPASHGPDKKTQKPWSISPKASLVGDLLAIVTLRSIHVWTRAKRQDL